MRVRVLVIAIVCLLVRSTSGQNDAQRDAIAKVHALENSWNQAEAIGDVRALDLISDNSMIYVDEDGALLSKAQFLNRMTRGSGTVVQWLVTPTMDVHLYGDIAVVVGSYRVKGVQEGSRMRGRDASSIFGPLGTVRGGAWQRRRRRFCIDPIAIQYVSIRGRWPFSFALCWIVLVALAWGHAQTSMPPDDQQSRVLSLENAWNQSSSNRT